VIAIDRASRSQELEGDHPAGEGDARAASAGRRLFVASYLKDARTQVKVFDLDGKFVREVELPRLGTAAASAASGGHRDVLLLHQLRHAADASTATT
jgi:sugar lactone lactonase YvrE